MWTYRISSGRIGRYHKILELARFVRVRQTEPGKATIVISFPQGTDREEIAIEQSLDLSDVAVDFDFEIRTELYVTSAGKVPLLVKGEVT